MPISFQLNGTSVGNKISARVIEAIYQGDCEKDEKGVTSALTEDVSGNGYIRVPKIPFVPLIPRTVGSGVNGSSFAQNFYTIANDEYLLQVLDVIDTPIVAPNITFDLCTPLKQDMYAGQFAKQVYVAKNAACLAVKLYSTLADVTKGNIVSVDGTTITMTKGIAQADSLLFQGDLDNSIDTFLDDTRLITLTPAGQNLLQANGSYFIGGSNYAQVMQKDGVISPDDKRRLADDGFIGKIANTDVHVLSGLRVNLADRYLGFPAGTIAAFCYGVDSSSLANVYGLAAGGVKAVDAQEGQGIKFQPLYRYGAATLFPKGNAFLFKAGYVNPFSIYTLANAALTLSLSASVKAPGSRPEALTAVVASTAGEFTVNATYTTRVGGVVTTGVSANANVSAVAYVQLSASAAAPTNLEDFLIAYNGTTVTKGIVASATAVAGVSATAGNKVYALAIYSDGTVSSVGSATIA